MEPTSGTVGARFSLIVSATAPDLQNLETLPLFETQTTWTAIGDPQVSDSPRGALHTRTYTYTIVPFETGREAVPAIAVTYSPKDGATSNTVLSEPLWVEVNSVLSGNGSASALREVSPPTALPVPAAVVWTSAIILLLLVGLLGWWLWRRYSARLKRMLGRALSPPELALKQIDDLENERLIEHKKIKEFYTRLSDAMREYVQAAYGVQAMDLTSNELLRELDERAGYQPAENADGYRRAVARLSEMLDEADLVKFARLMPEVSRCRKALQSGRDVVMLTKYRFEPVEDPASNRRNARVGGPPSPPPVPSPAAGPTAPPYPAESNQQSEGSR